MERVTVLRRNGKDAWADDTLTASLPGGPPQFDGLHVYCGCARPDAPDTWLFMVAPVIQPSDVPEHAVDLPFPFTLPLFPAGPVWLVQAICGSSPSGVGLVLGTPPDVPVVRYLPLTVRLWKDNINTCWHECLRDRDTKLALLRSAFDKDWTATADVDVEDAVDADVLLQALLVPDALPCRRKHVVREDDEPDELPPTDVNAFTGLVVEDSADDGASDELDFNADNDEDDEDEDNGDDDDDDDDEDEDDDDNNQIDTGVNKESFA